MVKEVPEGYAILRSNGVSGATSISEKRIDFGAPSKSSSFQPKPPTGPTTSALAVIGRPESD
jgi:hypothetical protein